ncbi:winged helix-turn-helix domain-containing protein [Actinomycetes bacterium M1A6_2h]
MREMTADAARHIAVAAQGFGQKPPAKADRRALAKVLASTQLLQIDSVSVAVRAHYAPIFSRIGPYDRDLLDTATWAHTARKPRMLVEYWAHEAALMPVEDWPLMKWRMRKYENGRYGHAHHVTDRNPRLGEDIRAIIDEVGPSSSADLEKLLGMQRTTKKGPWWDPTDVKVVCEQLFASGRLSVERRVGFARQYELPEKVLPAGLPSSDMSEEDAIRALVAKSARALGIATEPDLRDYYRLKREQTTPAIVDLVESGLLEPVSVRGWGAPAYLHRDVRTPRKSVGAALLCPFDPLIFFRPRTERIFDFRYRIEIYTPEPKRQYGYYVFPFLLDGELRARVDIKADRAANALRVPGAFLEPGHDRKEVVTALRNSLREMASWLGLDDVIVGDRGNLAQFLRS